MAEPSSAVHALLSCAARDHDAATETIKAFRASVLPDARLAQCMNAALLLVAARGRANVLCVLWNFAQDNNWHVNKHQEEEENADDSDIQSVFCALLAATSDREAPRVHAGTHACLFALQYAGYDCTHKNFIQVETALALQPSTRDTFLSINTYSNNASASESGALHDALTLFARWKAEKLSKGSSLCVVALVSGGKDSVFSMLKCKEYGHDIVALANLCPLQRDQQELDSHMFQSVSHHLIHALSECTQVPLVQMPIQGKSVRTEMTYVETKEDEVEDLFRLLERVKLLHPTVNAVSCGAILSTYQRLRLEHVCHRLNLIVLCYLWKREQSALLDEMIQRGIVAILVKVASYGLSSRQLGMTLGQAQRYFESIKHSHGLNVCGEGGEYETFCLDAPFFKKSISILQQELQGNDSRDGDMAPVCNLYVSEYELLDKKQDDEEEKEKTGITGEHVLLSILNAQDWLEYSLSSSSRLVSIGLSPSFHQPNRLFAINNNHSNKNMFLRSGPFVFIPRCPLSQLPSQLVHVNSYNDSFNSENKKSSLVLRDVFFADVVASDMSMFASINQEFKQLFPLDTLAKAPSRACVQALPTTATTTNSGAPSNTVDFLLCRDSNVHCSNLHVQSRSEWAPSSIGPYSQCSMVALAGRACEECDGEAHKEVLCVLAGQIGLIPGSMELECGLRRQLLQAVRNCVAVLTDIVGFGMEQTVLRTTIYISHHVNITALQAAWVDVNQKEALLRESFWGDVTVARVAVLPRHALVELQLVAYQRVNACQASPAMITAHSVHGAPVDSSEQDYKESDAQWTDAFVRKLREQQLKAWKEELPNIACVKPAFLLQWMAQDDTAEKEKNEKETPEPMHATLCYARVLHCFDEAEAAPQEPTESKGRVECMFREMYASLVATDGNELMHVYGYLFGEAAERLAFAVPPALSWTQVEDVHISITTKSHLSAQLLFCNS